MAQECRVFSLFMWSVDGSALSENITESADCIEPNHLNEFMVVGRSYSVIVIIVLSPL